MPPPELHYFSHSVRKEKGARAKRDTICYSVRGNKNSSQPCQKSGLRMQTPGSDSSLVSRRFASPAHAHVHAQWPGGLRRALWMKKRSHLSDSSLLHLAASFKNTLYSSLRLKLHLTDSMMESTILPPFLPPPSLLPPSSVSGASSVFSSWQLTALAKKRKTEDRLEWRSKRAEVCTDMATCLQDYMRSFGDCVRVWMFISKGRSPKNQHKPVLDVESFIISH